MKYHLKEYGFTHSTKREISPYQPNLTGTKWTFFFIYVQIYVPLQFIVSLT